MFTKKSICTIPNAITFMRLLLIAPFIHFYRGGRTGAALVVVLLSVLSDVADGAIARKFNMVSDFGKALDPVVDKINQAAAIFCLTEKYPHMIFLLIVLIVKELTSGILTLRAIRKSGAVQSADWHGKLTTACLYTTFAIHLLFPVKAAVSDILIGLCTAIMALSFVLYTIRNIGYIRSAR